MSDSSSENKMMPLLVGGVIVIGLIVFGVMKTRNGIPAIEPPPSLTKQGDSGSGQAGRPAPTPGAVVEPEGRFVAKAELKESGMGSPEKSLRTYLAAVLKNDFDRMAAAMTPEKGQQFSNLMNSPALSGDLLAAMTNTLVHQRTGFRIVASEEVSEMEKILAVRFGAANEGSVNELTTFYTMKKVAGEWKLAHNASAPLN